MGQKCEEAVSGLITQNKFSCKPIGYSWGLHSKTSLQIEIGLLPLKWEVKKRCIKFWHKVMTMGEKGC